MLDDNIRIRIPSHLKQRFKESRPHGKMTDLLTAVIIATLEGADLAKLSKNRSPQTAKVRTKYQDDKDSYIRFLIDTETKEKFKLFCYLKGTTMSDFLREAVEDVLREEVVVVPVRRLTPVARSQSNVDIGEMWRQTFGGLCA
jgi:predicted DNA-binding protein